MKGNRAADRVDALRGTLKIARLMRETGHEPPPVSVREGAVVFIFGLPVETPGKTPGIILGLLRAEPGLSVPELAARVGPDKGGHWQVIE